MKFIKSKKKHRYVKYAMDIAQCRQDDGIIDTDMENM